MCLQVGTFLYEKLFYERFTIFCAISEGRVISGYISPAEEFLTQFFDNFLYYLCAAGTRFFFLGQQSYPANDETRATGVGEISSQLKVGRLFENLFTTNL